MKDKDIADALRRYSAMLYEDMDGLDSHQYPGLDEVASGLIELAKALDPA